MKTTIRHLPFLTLLARAPHAGGTSWFATPTTFVGPSSFRHAPHQATASSSSSSSLLLGTIHDHDIRPDATRSNNLIYATNDTVDLLREELKSRLLVAADAYRETRAKADAIERVAAEGGISVERFNDVSASGPEKENDDRGYAMRLLRRIVRKISKTKGGARSPPDGGILSSDSFRQTKLDVGAYGGDRVVEIAEQLSLLNPTPIPTLGFKNYGGASSAESKLGGVWKLLFTTAADASFPETEKRGIVSTSQVIDPEYGTLTNVIDFERGKLRGLRVVVEGEPTSDTDIALTFRAVKIIRKSRFPRLFGEISVRLPSKLIRWIASRGKVKEERIAGPYLRLRYVDSTLRMHTTDSGNWFIQTRI
ncbi:hypothetical protein ACHAXA_011557 [Cyclostephanos tholiformis]|uniref:Plastid lipid-associated protein/fibrillin conserved domain-containing protein n=1 Tax=Cyclostephanos tholiformis TaxID=382380 RepID=A0ABD3R847_9STRA